MESALEANSKDLEIAQDELDLYEDREKDISVNKFDFNYLIKCLFLLLIIFSQNMSAFEQGDLLVCASSSKSKSHVVEKNLSTKVIRPNLPIYVDNDNEQVNITQLKHDVILHSKNRMSTGSTSSGLFF